VKGIPFSAEMSVIDDTININNVRDPEKFTIIFFVIALHVHFCSHACRILRYVLTFISHWTSINPSPHGAGVVWRTNTTWIRYVCKN